MPTNDELMKYNKTYHRYVLDIENLKKEFGIDFVDKFGSLTKANNKALQISNRIYNFIYNHKQRSKRYWEWYLAFNDEVRPIIKKALIAQAVFEDESSVSALQHQIGINLLNGVTINEKDLKGTRGIALEAENELRFFKDGMLLYTGKQIYLPDESSFDYEEYNY